ncbi:TlpA disulfide reductase family protein [Prevotella sp. 10(H)]|uniref:TlpA family protein disulfide reductase n=1 Tax=Prevotella sp. 10(H) TaxID=1158294 RepID=UPI0004A6E4FB|nr:TlpA disulfide reductase family protein [Prevotella sp. 10(H)]
MKYNILLLLSLFLIIKAEAQNNKNEKSAGFNLELNIPSQKNNRMYLGYYWNGATYARDSVVLSSEGKAKLNLAEELSAGQYFLYAEPDFRVDLLLDKGENNIHLFVDEKDFSKSTATGSPNTVLLWKYLTDIQQKDSERLEIETQLENDAITLQKRKELEDRKNKLDESASAYTESVIKNNTNNWFGVFLKGMQPISLPYPQPKDENEFLKNKEYGKVHYFDNVDLTDPRLWRTNYFTSYIDTYLNQWADQIPDSLAVAASRLVAKTKGNDYCFREMLSRLTNESLKSTRMGDENIWAKLAEDYIFDKDVIWIDSTQNSELRRKYELIKNNRIGMKAQNLELQTMEGKTINTNEIPAEFLILYFYDPECGHCQTSTPKLHNGLYAKYKSKGVEVVAIDIVNNKQKWEAFVNNKKLTDWINCADPEYKSNFWMNYDTSGVPSVYVLNRNKIILAKMLDEENLEKLFKYYIKD